MTTNGGHGHDLSDIPPNSWVRTGGTYYHYKGYAPDGTPRLAKLSRRPYGRTYTDLDTMTVHQAPGGVHPSTALFLTATLIAAVTLPLALHGQSAPLIFAGTAVPSGAFLLTAVICHWAPMKPQDAIEFAEGQAALDQAAWESTLHAAERRVQHALDAQEEGMRWQRATWAQQAAINAALHPDEDTYRPYGQSPPL
ncbi:hypothetical protein ACFZAM_31595 [Streptomyces sp. NPDC008079]|uniref:hypothetical protein n=1 Tax=Streptomyces sp. NPDC008079 TaxID=3364806 RepID=UPI0036E78FDA